MVVCLLVSPALAYVDIQFDRMVENGQEVKALPWIGVGFEDGSSYILDIVSYQQQVALISDVPNTLGCFGHHIRKVHELFGRNGRRRYG